MAVLEKRMGMLLQAQDAYIKVAGGVKLDEPAIDLLFLMSIVSSYRDVAAGVSDCFIGEVGLTGEVRRVSRIEQRVQKRQNSVSNVRLFLLQILVVGIIRKEFK